MCGRARCSLGREAVLGAAHVQEQRWRDADRYRPSYNCSPGAWMPVVRLGTDGARELQTMKWGLVPSFTRLAPGERPDHYRMFNARCETLAQKSVFKRLLPTRRCVVLLDGFYEWQDLGGGRKQPFHVTTAAEPEQPAMYMAGLYDVFQDANGQLVHTFTIVTTDSSKPLTWLHCRMPVILTAEEEVAAWLGEGDIPCDDKVTRHPQDGAREDAGGEPDQGRKGAAAAKHAEADAPPASDASGQPQEPRGKDLGEGHEGSDRGEGSDGDDDDGGSGAMAEGGSKASVSCLALVQKICRPYDGPLLRWHPVTPEMSKPGYDKPDCCKDVRTKKGAISSFFKSASSPAGGAARHTATPNLPAAPKAPGETTPAEQDSKPAAPATAPAPSSAAAAASAETRGASPAAVSAGNPATSAGEDRPAAQTHGQSAHPCYPDAKHEHPGLPGVKNEAPSLARGRAQAAATATATAAAAKSPAKRAANPQHHQATAHAPKQKQKQQQQPKSAGKQPKQQLLLPLMMRREGKEEKGSAKEVAVAARKGPVTGKDPEVVVIGDEDDEHDNGAIGVQEDALVERKERRHDKDFINGAAAGAGPALNPDEYPEGPAVSGDVGGWARTGGVGAKRSAGGSHEVPPFKKR